ncbi:MAG: hypothetical protein ACR2MG_09785 [Pyrinomonadaceae bacterium]|jgi:hypothetical protein
MFLRQNLSSPSLESFSVFFLFRKSPGFDDYSEIEKLKDTPINFSRIRCPLCRWQPRASSLWYCYGDLNSYPGCGTAWNTFETRGRCPNCKYQWHWTECLRCGGTSPHEAWYEDEAEQI